MDEFEQKETGGERKKKKGRVGSARVDGHRWAGADVVVVVHHYPLGHTSELLHRGVGGSDTLNCGRVALSPLSRQNWVDLRGGEGGTEK